jgi:beta-lactam-binding protein with PASTA domain
MVTPGTAPISILDCHSHDGSSFRAKRPKYLLLLSVAIAALAFIGCSKKVVVPNVLQQDLEQAKQTLASMKLKPGNINGPQAPGSYVVSQSPGSGLQVSANTQVDLTVESPVAVPNLTNNKVTDAISSLQANGLMVAFIKQPALNLFGGSKVLAQTPAVATMVHRGTVVTVTVAMPPDLGKLVGLVTKEPAYEKLDPQYRQVLDEFLK